MRHCRETPDFILQPAVVVDAFANPGDDPVHGLSVQV